MRRTYANLRNQILAHRGAAVRLQKPRCGGLLTALFADGHPRPSSGRDASYLFGRDRLGIAETADNSLR